MEQFCHTLGKVRWTKKNSELSNQNKKEVQKPSSARKHRKYDVMKRTEERQQRYTTALKSVKGRNNLVSKPISSRMKSNRLKLQEGRFMLHIKSIL